MRARLQLLSLLVLLQLSGVFGGFYYTLNGTSQYATATQLWYDGLWKEVRQWEDAESPGAGNIGAAGSAVFVILALPRLFAFTQLIILFH